MRDFINGQINKITSVFKVIKTQNLLSSCRATFLFSVIYSLMSKFLKTGVTVCSSWLFINSCSTNVLSEKKKKSFPIASSLPNRVDFNLWVKYPSTYVHPSVPTCSHTSLLEMKPTGSSIWGKCSVTKLHPALLFSHIHVKCLLITPLVWKITWHHSLCTDTAYLHATFSGDWKWSSALNFYFFDNHWHWALFYTLELFIQLLQ